MPPVEIARDLYFVQRGYLSGNHFVYRSERPVLIDTGYVSRLGETERSMGQLGVDPARVSLIINTHCHCDHVGGNRAIQEKSGCQVAAHTVGKHFIDTRDDWSTWWRYFDQEADFFSCTRAIEEGEIIAIGPHRFEVIHTPGHSADSIVLYNPKEKILISSDTLWERDMAVVNFRVEGSGTLFALLRSLEKIESLEVRSVFPGHGKPFTDFAGAIERARERTKTYMARRDLVGEDLLKKIFVYTILMSGAVDEDTFFHRLLETYWFRETVDLYFQGDYRLQYDETLNALTARGAVSRANGRITTTVRP